MNRYSHSTLVPGKKKICEEWPSGPTNQTEWNLIAKIQKQLKNAFLPTLLFLSKNISSIFVHCLSIGKSFADFAAKAIHFQHYNVSLAAKEISQKIYIKVAFSAWNVGKNSKQPCYIKWEKFSCWYNYCIICVRGKNVVDCANGAIKL